MLRRAACILLLLLACPARAQDDDIPLKLNAQDITVIGNALAERPYREVKPVIDRLQRQIDAHVAKSKEPAAEKPAEPSERRDP